MDPKTLLRANLGEFTSAYTLIGSLELRLREAIPRVLKDYADKKGYSEWHNVLCVKGIGEVALEQAKDRLLSRAHSGEEIEDFLPLSFWRHLLSNRQYGALWLPALYRVFPEVNNPKDNKVFQNIDKNMDTALRLRNSVAHFNMQSLPNIEFSKKKVQWLLDALDNS
jgi:hypothetical protein